MSSELSKKNIKNHNSCWGQVMPWQHLSLQDGRDVQVSFQDARPLRPREFGILVITCDFREEMVSSSSCLREAGINPLNFVSYSCRM